MSFEVIYIQHTVAHLRKFSSDEEFERWEDQGAYLEDAVALTKKARFEHYRTGAYFND